MQTSERANAVHMINPFTSFECQAAVNYNNSHWKMKLIITVLRKSETVVKLKPEIIQV